VDEIHWATTHERTTPWSYLQKLPRCIKFIDGTLIEILQPWWDPGHWTWFNGCKTFYAMNNTFTLDHIGLFIYIDFFYPGFYHDVSILQPFSIYQQWQQYFIHDDEYFEFLLGDPMYMGEEMFIMWRIGR
jgi:hypothetical protein